MAGATALGLSRELHTQPIRNRPRTSRWGRVEHKPVATSSTYAEPPRRAHSPRATSCRNLPYDQGRQPSPAPAASGKWLYASVTDDAAAVIAAGFAEADRRDPDRQRTWVALV